MSKIKSAGKSTNNQAQQLYGQEEGSNGEQNSII